MSTDRIVLACSGGLDTSVEPWGLRSTIAARRDRAVRALAAL